MKRNLTFFYTGNIPSGKIRGEQVSTYLGAKQNPTSDYADDTCIYAKCRPPEITPQHSFIDVVDSRWLLLWVEAHPKLGIIAISNYALNYIRTKLNRKDVYFIPEHHCNFDREQRTRKDITTVGYIGCRTGSEFPSDIVERFADIGLNFKYSKKYETRLDVINFYKSIDIQVVGAYIKGKASRPLKNPLKIANAGSFGIPTVSYPESSFVDEFGECFVRANTIKQSILQCKKLKEDKTFYEDIAGKVLERAENFHISKIAPLYQQLGEQYACSY